MPVYNYRCDSCGVQFERFQKFSEQTLTRCPECGKKSLRKVYTPVGIIFKGSGFYSTDNRSPSGQGHTTTAKSDEKSGTDSGDKSKEPKPAKPAVAASAESKPAAKEE
jgi:putative FmdB family regulatory protein